MALDLDAALSFKSFLSNNGNQEVANEVFKATGILGSYFLQSIEELNCSTLANVSIHERLSEASKKRTPKLSEKRRMREQTIDFRWRDMITFLEYMKIQQL